MLKSRLYLVTNRYQNRDLVADVEQALREGICILQYREKDRNRPDYLATAQQLQGLCSEHGTLFVVNDDLELALRLDADGLHIGQNDVPYHIARVRLGDKKIIGVSGYSVEQALHAQGQGANYIGIHTWDSAATKPTSKDARPVGIEGFRNIRDQTSLPCVSIGGITLERIPEVMEAGADYIAMASAILTAKDIGKTVIRMNKLVNQIEQERGYRRIS